MPLSKCHIDTKNVATPFDVEKLSSTLQAELPQVVFAYLHGSAVSGVVSAHSDLDVALFVEPAGMDVLSEIYAAVDRGAESIVPGVREPAVSLRKTAPVSARGAIVNYNGVIQDSQP